MIDVLHSSRYPAIIPEIWIPPLGIPIPSWPIDINMSRPNLPSPWITDTTGFYFLSASGCSDTHTNGNPLNPRCTLPASVPAGSVIVFDGTITSHYVSPNDIDYSGTSVNPIWIMGYNPLNRPIFTVLPELTGSYLILDNLDFNASTYAGIDVSGNHILIRNINIVNSFTTPNGAGIGIHGQNIIVYKIIISQMGDWLFVGPDTDRVGIKVYGTITSNIWIVDSQFYHIQSDGVAVGDANNTPSQVQRIYVGRNVAYENLQGGFWVKNAIDVIFSENISHTHLRNTSGGIGHGMGGQYDPQYVWFINNKIYDCLIGINIVGTLNGGGGPWFAIGNIVYDINYSGDCSPYGVGAILYRNDGGFTAIFNTVNDVAVFGGFAISGGTITLNNNIFSFKRSNACAAFESMESLTHDYNLFSSVGYDPGNETHKVVGDPLFISPNSNLSLQSNSPAINMANPSDESAFITFFNRYGIDIRKDITGTIRPQGNRNDIGAYETVGI